MSLLRISLLIWLAAFACRLILIFGFGKYELFRPEPVRIAISLATHGSFADPYPFPTGVTAHTAPFHPAVLSVIYRIFGDNSTADFVRISFAAAVASVQYALLPLAAQSLGI